MANILVGVIGEDGDCEEILFKGFKKFYPDELVLFTKKEYMKVADKIEKNIAKFDIKVTKFEMTNAPHLEEVFMKIRDLCNLYKNDTSFLNLNYVATSGPLIIAASIAPAL